MTYIGELAALATSLMFSFGSTFFTFAGRQLGAMVVNRTRLVMTVLLLIATHWVVIGAPFPFQAEPDRWLWLSLSGVVGLVLGDFFLFRAFVSVGPRISMLMMSLAPVIAALQAWLFLDEVMSLGQIAGIMITIGGIAWVVLERNGADNAKSRDYTRGILYGLGGALGQASGLVLAKNGLGGEFSAISGNLIRMIAATIVLWLITFFQKEASQTLQILIKNRRGVMFTLGGAIFGPFLGVSFSLLSVQHAEIGVASTLMALPPVLLLPISYFVFKERFGWGAIAGTFLAITGVALLFLV